jgi:type I restriction enzyme, S subunit
VTSIKLRRIATSANGAGFPHAYQGKTDGDLPFFKVSDFNLPGNERYLSKCTNWITRSDAVELGARLVPPGSILLPKVGAALLGNARRIVTCPSLFDNNILAIVPRIEDSRYLHYWMTTIDSGELSYPGPVPSLTGSEFLDLLVPMQSVPYQRAIADFLDAETTRIDALIAKKRQLTEVLIQRTRAEADSVLGGVTETVPVRRVISRLTSGPRGWASHIADSGAAFLTIANVQRDDVELKLNKIVRVTAPDNAEARRTRARAGDVVISITADIGSVGIVRDGLGEAYVSQHLALLTPSRCLTDWLAYALWGSAAQRQLDSARYGGTKTQLALEDVVNVRIAMPDKGEQLRLVDTLRNVRRRCLITIERLQKQVDLLSERRQALITAAVTGQIEVPGVAAS